MIARILRKYLRWRKDKRTAAFTARVIELAKADLENIGLAKRS